jgi:hypothetical protein
MRARLALTALALVVVAGCGGGTVTPVGAVTVTVTAAPTVDRNSAGYQLAAADGLGADPAKVAAYQRLVEEAADGCAGTPTQLADQTPDLVRQLADDHGVRTSNWALLTDVASRAGSRQCALMLLAYGVGQLPVPAYALPR